MLLRATLEKTLPVRDGEARLSPAARRYAFQGPYMMRGRITSVATRPNTGVIIPARFPYLHTVTRNTILGCRITRFTHLYAEPEEDVVEELMQTPVLSRANRIEQVARGFKGVALLALVASAATGTPRVIPGSNTAESADLGAVRAEPCAEILDGTETLRPADTRTLLAAQEIGQTVCTIGDNKYLVTPVTTN